MKNLPLTLTPELTQIHPNCTREHAETLTKIMCTIDAENETIGFLISEANGTDDRRDITLLFYILKTGCSICTHEWYKFINW